MTEPNPARPVPGPPRPGAAEPTTSDEAGERFPDLDQRPVREHVAVFEEEHDRLQRQLGTIDQL